MRRGKSTDYLLKAKNIIRTIGGAIGIIIPKKKVINKRRKSDIINDQVLADIMTQAEKIPTIKKKNAYKIAILILYHSGMRIDCLRFFDKNNIRQQFFENKTNYIKYIPNKRKGSQAFLSFYMDGYTMCYIRKLYTQYKKANPNTEPFDRETEGLRSNFNTFLKSTGHNITSHSFRRSILTRVIEKEGIHTAKMFIGHSSVNATERYYLSHLNEQKIKEIHEINKSTNRY